MRKGQRNKAAMLIMPLLLAVSLVTGCGVKRTDAAEVKEGTTYVYVTDPKEEHLYAVAYTTQHSSYSEVIDEYLTQMKNSGRADGYVSVLPEGLNLRSYTFENGLLTLDFNAVYNQMNDVQEALTRSAIVLTMLQIPNVERVLITVDGETLTNSLKRAIEPMDRESIVLEWEVVR